MTLLAFDQALEQLLAGACPIGQIEMLPSSEALSRVLAEAQISRLAVPPLDNSSMDGYAIRCADISTPGTTLQVEQRIPAGCVGHTLAPGTAARIFTGAPIPEGADAIVMQEMCAHPAPQEQAAKNTGQAATQMHIVINHVPKPGDWIRRRGEDIQHGAEVLAAGTRLTAPHLGLAASIGIARLPVFRRLRVALFSTGNELVMPGEVEPSEMPPGSIYNSNRYLLRGLLQQLGCQVTDLGIVPDDLAATRAAFREAAETNDLILTSGGVSVGEEDHVKPAVQAEGELSLWKIAIKPGKPLAFGHIRKQAQKVAFIGLPGNPVSCFVTFLMLVRPFILKSQGVHALHPRPILIRADFDLPRPDSRREFLRARRNQSGGVELFPNQSSGVLTSAVWSDGLIDNPARTSIKRGQDVSFLPFTELLY